MSLPIGVQLALGQTRDTLTHRGLPDGNLTKKVISHLFQNTKRHGLCSYGEEVYKTVTWQRQIQIIKK